jgi:uncharacterized membrane protein YfcA
MDVLVLVGLAAGGLVGGFVNTLAGGGSMIMVPTLMLFGLPADVANGTSRVPILAQCLAGTATFARAGRLEARAALDAAPLTILGALAGAYVATLLPNGFFEPLLLGTMIVMGLALLARPDSLVPPEGTPPRRAMGHPGAMLTLVVAGFYGGILQAGAGLVFLALFGSVLRYDLVRGNALKVIVMALYVAATVVVFALRGRIAWAEGVAMTVGAVLGSVLGARVALRRGQAFVRYAVVVMIVVVCLVVALR